MVRSTLNTSSRIRKVSIVVAVSISLVVLAILPGIPLTGMALSDQHTALGLLGFTVSLPSTGGHPSMETLAKGKFLVASRNLRDPNFSETVILLIDYDWNGAMGLVINRPSRLRLSEVLPEIKGLKQRTDTVYFGGPVGRSQMLLLVRSGSQLEESHPVSEDIYISSSRMVLQRMIDHADAKESFRVYAGYAGWAPGQLNQEVSKGSWHIFEADAKIVFDMEPSEIWPELIRRSSVLYARIQAPDWKVLQSPFSSRQ